MENSGLGPFHWLLGLYVLVTVLRAMMQYLQADFHNPVSQFIHRITKPPIAILRRFVPRIDGADVLSPIVLVVIFAGLEKFLFINNLNYDTNIVALVLLTAASIVNQIVNVFIGAVLIRVILSWVAPRGTMITRLVVSLSEPVMAPVRRIIPSFGGLDFSPIAVLLILEIVNRIAVGILKSIGYRLLG